jgi:hypothetical protein
LAFGNIYIKAVVNIPSGHALHLTTQEMVHSRLVHGKISTDNKYSMNISNSASDFLILIFWETISS